MLLGTDWQVRSQPQPQVRLAAIPSQAQELRRYLRTHFRHPLQELAHCLRVLRMDRPMLEDSVRSAAVQTDRLGTVPK